MEAEDDLIYWDDGGDRLDDYYPSEIAEIIRRENGPQFSYSGAYANHMSQIRTPDSTIGYNISQNNTQNKMKKGFTVLKLADLAKELGLPSSRGHKTKDYLELTINEIQKAGYRFVQFLQLVDILYVIIENVEHQHKQTPVKHVYLPPEEFNPDKEIQNHYETPPIPKAPASTPIVEEVKDREAITEAPPELEEMKQRNHLKKSMKKNPLPWEK